LLLPREDEFLGEYVPDYNERLLWATGFSGSAGLAVIGQNELHLFVDGRYTLQAQKETTGFQIHSLSNLWKYLNNALKPSDIVGFNPQLHSQRFVEKLYEIPCEKRHIVPHPVDLLWDKRPPIPESITVPHELKYSGESNKSKLSRIISETASSAEVLYVQDPHEVAWALNIRGQDLPYTPITLSRALIWKNGKVDLFLNQSHLSNELRLHLGPQVYIHPLNCLTEYLLKPQCVQIDTNGVSAFDRQLIGGRATIQRSPILSMKAVKNHVEIEGMRKAHQWDGIALGKFRSWLLSQNPNHLDEITAAEQLETFRRECPAYKGPSFPTISGFGANGAIVHYHATPASNQNFTQHGLYLVDSGGQYLEGTTDVTRVFPIGPPTDEQKRAYTLVLKGHLRLAQAVFPIGTTGHQLDVLARYDVWQYGLNYEHGTGHGVGSYLSVHEGPQGISPRANATPLQPGMILSNEPGYYKTGEFGIRIENLMVVQESKHEGYLCFETLTQVPYESTLIDYTLLTDAERNIVFSY